KPNKSRKLCAAPEGGDWGDVVFCGAWPGAVGAVIRFGFCCDGEPADAAGLVSAGVVAAIGVSGLACSLPGSFGGSLACSRPTSRRGQTKSSARPAGGLSASPLTSVRAAKASTAAGREPGPPSN